MVWTSKEFMEAVTVWPGAPSVPGWVNLHCHCKNDDPTKNGGKPWVVGWPYKTVDDFMNRAGWLETTGRFYDIWFCTSQQRECKTNSDGKPKAWREVKNATWVRAIWIDIDIKPDDVTGKHYLTLADAMTALGDFIGTVGLPDTSAIVNSGGGLHVYWIADAPMSVPDWRAYAEGLKALLVREGVKCDTGLTTDCARLLRVPGTLNHKYSPPRLVKLIQTGRQYNFGTELSFLKNVAPVNSGQGTQTKQDDSPIDASFTASAPAAAFAGLQGAEALQAGIERAGPQLIDPRPVFKQCGFLRGAFATGGKDFDNPLWNLSVLCTAFMEKGDALAHAISKGHAGYTPASTQALFDRKVADRADRGIGYPSCATIAGAGSKACQTCPLLSKGKSPLNIRPEPKVTATVTPPLGRQPQHPDAASLNLPDNYDIDGDGKIVFMEQKKLKDGNVQEVPHKLFYSRIDMPWVQKDPDVIHFRASLDKGNVIWTSVRQEDWCGQGYEKKLAAARVKYVPENKGYLEGFFMAWLARMHDAAVAQTAQPFGWYREDGEIKGFAYGGFIHRDDGTAVQASLTSRAMQKRYTPRGQLAPWMKACANITMQKRPDLDLVIATSFASPLLSMTGATGATLCVWGDSGVGKTYALEIGAAVWGHPKETKEQLSSTYKNVEKTLTSIINLPIYWDEITDDNARKNVFNMLMLTTGGVRGGRLNSNTDIQEKGTWSTLVSINGNRSFKEYVAKNQPTHTAGLNRVLEYEVVLQPNGPGKVSPSVATQDLALLDHNFGNVGLDYAKMLGANHVAIQERVNEVLLDLETTLQPGAEDRFWISTMGALIVGAELAVKLGVDFDVPAMRDFLLTVFRKNQLERVEANVNPNQGTYAEDLLTGFLKENTMATIWTMGTPSTAGRASRTPFRRLMPNAHLPHGVMVRLDELNDTVSISRKGFEAWCERPSLQGGGGGISAQQAVKSLCNKYPVMKDRRILAAGTGLGGGQEPVLTIKVDPTKFPDLHDLIHSQQGAVNNSDLGASVGMSANEVDTGIAAADEEIKTNAA